MNNEIKLTEGAKIILSTVKDELFPTVNKLRDLVVRVHKCRISFPLYSKELKVIKEEFEAISAEFFAIAKKLETPDILFANKGNGSEDFEYMASYFQFKNGFAGTINDGTKAVEIIDRSVDRKKQSIQNAWTYLLAIVAIISSVIWS